MYFLNSDYFSGIADQIIFDQHRKKDEKNNILNGTTFLLFVSIAQEIVKNNNYGLIQ